MSRRAIHFGILSLAACLSSLPAQDKEQERLIRQREQKLKSHFLKKADWITDYDQARAKAKQEDKMIFVYFTRSYAP
ncbi:MAG: thioredoxin domain-containing protein [Planctomycetota bacterium]|jgi:hypothetical protein